MSQQYRPIILLAYNLSLARISILIIAISVTPPPPPLDDDVEMEDVEDVVDVITRMMLELTI